jgi:3-hydroxybutyryl-CoA dehydratase
MSSGPRESGETLAPVVRHITQEQVKAYARAARDFNPIHLDETFAATTRFGRPIAHGMLMLAFVSEMLGSAYPGRWASGGRLRVRFVAPVFPGDTVETFGEVVGIGEVDGEPAIQLTVGCRKRDGADVVIGRASVLLGEAPG